MQKHMKKLSLILGCAAILFLAHLNTAYAAENKELDVLFLHDSHSHLEQFPRIKTLINEQTAKNPDTLFVDGGDFSMGTLIQSVFETDAAELRMLGELGVDATTFGNHEYDYKVDGIVKMLTAAMNSGDALPELIFSNIDWQAMEETGYTEEQLQLKEILETYGFQEYSIIEKGNVKIALFGIMGVDSLDCAPFCPFPLRDASESVSELVDKVKTEVPDVDMFVCLSHSGTWADPELSEDEILAKNVPELDLIISGHTHSTLDKPIQHGNTYVVSSGEYGSNLGSLSLTETADGVWELTNYELIPVTDDIEEDTATKEKTDTFFEAVDTNYLKSFGYTMDQVLATNDIEFGPSSDLGSVHKEHPLGNIMSDAYRYMFPEADASVVPAGLIRDTYYQGDVTVENVYNAFSLGIGVDGVAGYPLVKLYLTGAELKIAAEIDASISDLMTYARLYFSGLGYSFNPNRMLLNKTTDSFLMDMDGNRTEIEDDKLYCAVTDYYSLETLGSVTDLSFGLLSIIPKYEDGTPVEDYADLIITKNGREVKAWEAMAAYLDSFEDTDGDGISNIPEKYASTDGRKVVEDSTNLLDLLKSPNKYFAMIVGLAVVLLALVVVIIVVVVKVTKKVLRSRRK